MLKLIIIPLILIFVLALLPDAKAFIVQYSPLIALGLLVFLAFGINYKSKTVITKAPDKVIKITIKSDELK